MTRIIVHTDLVLKFCVFIQQSVIKSELAENLRVLEDGFELDKGDMDAIFSEYTVKIFTFKITAQAAPVLEELWNVKFRTLKFEHGGIFILYNSRLKISRLHTT